MPADKIRVGGFQYLKPKLTANGKMQVAGGNVAEDSSPDQLQCNYRPLRVK